MAPRLTLAAPTAKMMAAFELRPPTRSAADAIVTVVRACDVEELGAPDYDAEALLGEWREPGVVVERDARVAVEPDGDMVGYALLTGEDVRAWTRPDRRGRGIGSALLGFVHARAAEGGGRPLRQGIAAGNAAAHALLAAHGYAVVAHHRQMRLALEPRDAAPGAQDGVQPALEPRDAAPALPDGVGVRPYRAGEDDRMAHALLQAAFADVPGQPPRAFEAWRATTGPRAPHFDAGLWRVAERDGAPVGVLAAERREATGHVLELGVARAERGRGVGAALLGDAFARFAVLGLPEATLTVRTANANALRLYERLGMTAGWAVDALLRPAQLSRESVARRAG